MSRLPVVSRGSGATCNPAWTWAASANLTRRAVIGAPLPGLAHVASRGIGLLGRRFAQCVVRTGPRKEGSPIPGLADVSPSREVADALRAGKAGPHLQFVPAQHGAGRELAQEGLAHHAGQACNTPRDRVSREQAPPRGSLRRIDGRQDRRSLPEP